MKFQTLYMGMCKCKDMKVSVGKSMVMVIPGKETLNCNNEVSGQTSQGVKSSDI